jgi:hypothetical protein
MRDLAAALGQSLLFPVVCRYCGADIWLFATPEGGFAIFDAVGKPWPKHECWGIAPSEPRYAVPQPQFSKAYTFPVPESAAVQSPRPGMSVMGTLLSIEQATELPQAYLANVFTRRAIHPVFVDRSYAIGTCVTGVVYLEHARSWLREVRTVEMPAPEDVGAAGPGDADLPTPVRTLSRELLWTLQADAEALMTSNPTSAEDLAGALDAFLSGKPLTGTAALGAVVRASGQVLSTTLKARHARTLFLSLRDLGLEACAPTIRDWMSKGTLQALDSETRSAVEQVVRLGELKRSLESPERLRQEFSRRVRAEERFLRSFALRLPAIRSYVQALQQAV